MTCAYDKLYLEKARASLARMLDFAVNNLRYDITEFFHLFIASGEASRFESGNVSTLVGKSGVELAYDVLEKSGLPANRISPVYTINRSEEYWTGWALAYYQWTTALSFAEIDRYIPIADIRAMYHPYHEMDIRQFVDRMNMLLTRAKTETNLSLLRRNAGYSQAQLSRASGVPVRTIQQYEQRRKNINKAQAECLFQLASALGCSPSALMEKVTPPG